MATTEKARGILKIKRRMTNSVQGRAKAFSNGLLSNTAELGSLAAQANAIQAQSTVLDKAETVAKTKAPGSAAARNVQRESLIGLMVSTLALVQTMADAASSYDQAVSLLQAAGVLVAITPFRTKAILTVKQGPQAGSVALDANAAALGASRSRKTCFNWGVTADGGKTFTSLPSTPTSKTSLANLTPLTTYGFRVSVTDSSGIAGPWSQIVNFLVH